MRISDLRSELLNVIFIAPNYLVWEYKSQRNFCCYTGRWNEFSSTYFQSKALSLPPTEMNAKPLLCMTSAEIPQGCHNQWLYLHCWPAAGCWTSSSCGVCSPAVFARTVQCCLQCWLPGYPAPALLSPSLPLHPPFLPKESWHTAGWYATHP